MCTVGGRIGWIVTRAGTARRPGIPGTTTMLISGTAIEKLDSMRSILERHAKLSLTSSSNMRQLITPMLQKEIDGIIHDCRGQNLVVIFDGTSKSYFLFLSYLFIHHFFLYLLILFTLYYHFCLLIF